MSVAVLNPVSISTSVPTAVQFPPHLTDTDHRQRCLEQLRNKTSNLEKYTFLNGLKERSPTMFYDILLSNMMEIIPILYTPTVGDACYNYSHIWSRPEGLYVSIEHKGRIRDVLRTWPAGPAARIAVVTDGSRILGLGDLGANGLPISIGKLDLYIAGAGVRPSSTLPICLDVGTNTQKFLDDPLYIGIRRKRPDVKEMDEFMEEFMSAMQDVFPELLVQFEDFSTDNAFKFLNGFQNRYRCFNDDIQGTGAVVLSGFVNAAHLASEASGIPLKDHRILFFGAGSSGIGVAKQLLSFFRVQGLSEEDAKNRIYTVDSKGLITADHFARTDYHGPPLKKLEDIVEYVKPTALLGLSTLSKAFTEDVVKLMARFNKRPIIFPLSNPVSLSEVDFADAIKWTNGSVIFASGSPYEPVRDQSTGKVYEAGQGNNMYMFPGIGLGAILSKAQHVTDGMIEQASLALSSCLKEDERKVGLVYPRLIRIRDISAVVALRVARQAQKEGVDNNTIFRNLSDQALLEYIKDKMWDPSECLTRGRF
ncbi:hypothetical protein E1B28_012534 [Marasmius oreades]|uniref:Malic enzyme n=1 Tax=Marasmius oreades TaxID=181124 RepID=A0A9P7RSB0_9AGAR|nr:uncharacterized protein E1B28_012534 [Marasmius oreades]KAG7088552.1 hypothetical protein E1B28_012534 [Marasmius oreades]